MQERPPVRPWEIASVLLVLAVTLGLAALWVLSDQGPLLEHSGRSIQDSILLWRRLAAFVMLSSRATMRKYLNTRNSMEIAPFMKSFFSLYHGKERGFRIQVDGFRVVVQRKIYIIETQQVLRIT